MNVVSPVPVSIPYLRLKGQPYERGIDRGRALSDLIQSRIARERTASSTSDPRISELVAAIERSLEGIPRVLEEARGIAEGARVEWNDLMIAFTGMRGRMWIAPDCSCLVASREATSSGQTILGKNGDVTPPVSTGADLVLIEVRPDHGYSYITAGVYPEQPVMPEAMNEMGLAIVGCGQRATDARKAYEDGSPAGVSVYDLSYRVLTECSTTEEAVAVLERSPRGYSGRSMLVADAHGSWAKLEIGYDHLSVSRPERGAAYPANFVAAAVSGVFTGGNTESLLPGRSSDISAFCRYDRYMELLTQSAGHLDRDAVTAILRDHRHGRGTRSICKHADNDPENSYHGTDTLASVIFEPERRRALLASGHPCEATYAEFTAFA